MPRIASEAELLFFFYVLASVCTPYLSLWPQWEDPATKMLAGWVMGG